MFQKALNKESFAELYAWANELMHPIPEHLLPITEGEWIKFDQGSDQMPLVQSVRGWGTGWCTAGEQTAKTQLATGDFWIFKSLDDVGQATIPRLAIRMEGDHIAEVRGIAKKQNVDPFMGEVLSEKLKTIPGGEVYSRRTNDMAAMSAIEKKSKAREPLTKDDLTFHYEINAPIQYFGYVKDPRIAELRQGRNAEEDILAIFDCPKEQIAHTPLEINADTKAYVGSLVQKDKDGVIIPIFDLLLESIEHIYTSFPGGKVRREQIELGGRRLEDFEQAVESAGNELWGEASFMLKSQEFKRSLYVDDACTKLKSREQAKFIRLTVADLGFPGGATIKEIFDRKDELGLEFCSSGTGPEYRIQYTDQPDNEYVAIGMQTISDASGKPRVFTVCRRVGVSRLSVGWARPDGEWNADNQFLFRPRKLPLKT